MSDLIHKIKHWYEKVTTTKSSYERDGVKPAHDWIIMLISTIIIIILLAGAAYYFYIKIDAGEFFVVADNSAENEAKINKTLLNKIVNDINLREQTTLDIKQNKSIPSDPSI